MHLVLLIVWWMTTKKAAKTTFFARVCTPAETHGFVCRMVFSGKFVLGDQLKLSIYIPESV